MERGAGCTKEVDRERVRADREGEGEGRGGVGGDGDTGRRGEVYSTRRAAGSLSTALHFLDLESLGGKRWKARSMQWIHLQRTFFWDKYKVELICMSSCWFTFI